MNDRPEDRIFDVVVLGGGPAGYACALHAADLGLTVSLVEEDRLGGTCLHRGCIPTRAMLHAASLADSAGAPAHRWGLQTSFAGVDMPALLTTRDKIIERNERAVEKHLGTAHVEVFHGHGRAVGPREVMVEGLGSVRARRALVLATGSHPHRSHHVDVDGERVLDTTQTLRLDRVPRSVTILGGGAVGAEFSQIWRALGAEVTIVEIESRLVPFEDAAVGTELARALRRRDIKSVVGARITEAEVGDEVRLSLDQDGRTQEVTSELLIVAIGRSPNMSDVAELGVTDESGRVTPRSWSTLETDVEGVFAAGDLLPAPSPARAHVGFAEGMLVADAIAGSTTQGIDYAGVPRVTHGIIETACVGLSEEDARGVAHDVETMSMPLGGVAKGLMVGEPGIVKVVAERGGTVLGVHMVGPGVSELIGEATALVDYEASVHDAASLVHAHPTMSEALAELNMALAERPLHRR